MAIRDDILAASQAIADNADYRSTDSEAKAILFQEALDTLLILRPVSQSKGGTTSEELRFDHATLKSMRNKVDQFIRDKRLIATSSRVALKFGCFRD